MWKLDIFYKRHFGIPGISQKILRIMRLERAQRQRWWEAEDRGAGSQHHFSKDEKEGQWFPSFSVSKVENEDFHMENLISTF